MNRVSPSTLIVNLQVRKNPPSHLSPHFFPNQVCKIKRDVAYSSRIYMYTDILPHAYV